MRKMKYQNVRGTQDYLPSAEKVRRSVRRTLEDVFIQYGYQPIETPMLNYTELLASKYGGGAEILEEMYRLTDRGERDLALRYDLTIPFAKVMAMNPNLRFPFKRYEIGKVFRDGPIKTGRLREFTQCDVDVVGVESQTAEAELMMMALHSFRKLNLQVSIQFNNRKLLIGMLQMFKTPEDKINGVILTLDKMEKIGVDAVIEELRKQNLSSITIASIKEFLSDKSNLSYSYFETYATENELVNQGLNELKELEGYINTLDPNGRCVFNPFLARGLDIYTGTIYEVFLSDQTITSSVGGGGRYDDAISGFINTDKKYPTVGISFGLDVIYTALAKGAKKLKGDPSVDYYIVSLNAQKESFLVADYFREQGYKVELELSNVRLGKALDKANKENIPNVIIIGEDEVQNNLILIKDMDSGEEITEPFLYDRSL